MVNQQGRLMVSGDLTFLTVMPLWKQSLPLFAELDVLNVDLSQVSSSNSAGLALIIEWIKYAKSVNKRITFAHIPAQLESIIAASGMAHTLGSTAG